MKYTILILASLTVSGCWVNFNLFPKFEGKRKVKDNPAEISVTKEQWKALAGDPGLYTGPATAPSPKPATPPQADVPPGPATCTHPIILYARHKSGALCTCQECWEVFSCDIIPK